MKRKTFPILLFFLVGLSLIGVGFAGWVITGSDQKTIDDGQIQVDAVTDNRFLVEAVGWLNSKSTINLVADKSGTSFSNPWLTSDSDNENLSVTYQFKVKQGGEYITTTTNVTATATLGTQLNTEVSKESDRLVKLADGINLSNLTVNFNEETQTFSVTLTFAWGEKFGGKNPYKYYNALAEEEIDKEAAKTALTALHALNSQKITITITAK